MNNPRNHHFIPQVYLKEFSNSEKKLFQLKKGYKKISNKSVAQICYEADYFKVNSKDILSFHKLEDQYHIEKNIFKKQENAYPKLLRKITFPSLESFLLKKSDVLFFLEILITIKRRNPIYRNQIINLYKKHVASEQFKKDLEIVIDISKRVDNIDSVEYLKKYVEEAETNSVKQSDMYLQGFLDESNKTAKNAAEILLQYKLFIYHAPYGFEFLTSDNPGFTLSHENQLLSFGGFRGTFKFIFPLTPKCCLLISSKEIDPKYLLLTKEIQTIYTDVNTVNAINRNTYIIALKKVFSYTKNSLIQFEN